MKTTTWILASAALIAAGALLHAVLHKPQVPSGPEPVELSAATPESSEPAPAAVHVKSPAASAPLHPEPAVGTAPVQPSVPSETPAAPVVATGAAPVAVPVQQALSTLVSTQAGYEQKQAAWNELRTSGKLDTAIAELEKQAGSNPQVANYSASLGQAYLHKAGMLQDIREQGILGMKADQSFDAALKADPSNWEAGFWKAMAMSYWPPQLNKGQEVLERFTDLIKLQEAQTPQPQFSQSYVVLGEQYLKQGQADYARQVWQRGAALFPQDPKLQQKLSEPAQPAAPAQASAR